MSNETKDRGNAFIQDEQPIRITITIDTTAVCGPDGDTEPDEVRQMRAIRSALHLLGYYDNDIQIDTTNI